MVTAVLVLPIPGKTFFNRVSKLPDNLKHLIDDVLDIMDATFKLFNIVGDEVIHRLLRKYKSMHRKNIEIRDRIVTEELIKEELDREAKGLVEDNRDLNG